ncbi:hypothetical protein HS088_TW09G01269 [Tripterygium wilfordii]|uniref:DUF1764 domain-containing protein n=1 Tax=Tripterygium wilfordii TaxID=458696 RepID=A0A7J7DA86_TRIWF|nr:uncharacterized protein C6G9.01c [Tripterygium wilfordii]KAF5743204.1 hypothetical protein HS088_TW09G01269 [Tripterygium wilfordii]
MTKKGISKSAAQIQENPAVEQRKASSTPKKPGNEIDEIFSGKRKKKPEQKKTEKANGDLSVKAKVMKKKNKKSKEAKEASISDPPSQSRRRTEDGLSIYSEEELGLGKADAGSTPLCPFDCECCF